MTSRVAVREPDVDEQTAELMASVLDHTDELLLIVRVASRRIVAVSRGLAAEFPDDDLIGDDAAQYVAGGPSDGYPLLAAGRLDGYEVSREVRFVQRVANARIWVHVIGDERPSQSAVIVVDRDDAPGSATAFRRSETRLTVIGTVDDEWRLDRISTEVQSLLGTPASQLRGTSVFALVHPDDLAELFTGLGHTRLTSGGASVRLRLRCASGEWSWCRVKLGALGRRPAFGFVATPLVTDQQSANRSVELEERLMRIAHEVHAAASVPRVSDLPSMPEVPALATLTSREWEIVSRLAAGARIPEIATKMHLSPSTVRNHLSAVYRKLKVHSQAELLVMLYSRRV